MDKATLHPSCHTAAEQRCRQWTRKIYISTHRTTTGGLPSPISHFRLHPNLQPGLSQNRPGSFHKFRVTRLIRQGLKHHTRESQQAPEPRQYRPAPCRPPAIQTTQNDSTQCSDFASARWASPSSLEQPKPKSISRSRVISDWVRYRRRDAKASASPSLTEVRSVRGEDRAVASNRASKPFGVLAEILVSSCNANGR
jgi:hypothetical protein